jgi:TPR repeat protein
MYLTGHPVNADVNEALLWLEQAAALGSVEAMEMMADMYETGNGVQKSVSKAKEWRKRIEECLN